MASKSIGILTRCHGLEPIVKANSYLWDRTIFADGISPDGLPKEEEICRKFENVEIMLADLDLLVPLYEKLPKLKWVQSTFAGVDSLATKVRESKRVPHFCVTRLGGVYATQMAEYVIGQIIATERSFKKMIEAQKERNWNSPYGNPPKHIRCLEELTLGIIGVGDIGKTLARKSKALGMTVYGLKSSNALPITTEPFLDRWFRRDDLPMLLQQSDYICSILPLTTATNGIFSNGTLKHCKDRKSVFVNIGRGNVIRDIEIVEAIEKGWIRAAVLDVFEKEPLPDSSPLWDMSQVFISPHCASQFDGEQLVAAFLQNFKRYENGEPLRYLVNWEKEY